MLAIPRPDASQRALSLVLVALLHAALLFAVLRFMVVTPKNRVIAAPDLLEMIINTARKPVTVTAPPSKPAPALPRRGGVSSGAMPSFAPPVAPPDITGLGQALFDNYPFTREDQAR